MTLTCKKVCIKTTLIFHDLLYQQGLQYVFSLRDERKGKRTETETLDEGHYLNSPLIQQQQYNVN
jgi:hypothetical protein